jgi:hypothetical protein
MVIEDRDFRTQDEASSDCDNSRKDRERRDVRVLAWRAWRRNEIENYLLEPEVMLPVMVDAFGCTRQDVQNGLSEIIPTLVVYQATQYVLYRTRRSWNKSDPSRILPSNVAYRPTWNDDTCSASAPNRDAVRVSLPVNVEKWRGYFVSQGDSQEVIQGRDLMSDFDAKCQEWQNVNWDDPAWRIDWSGKEILHWLRIWLTAQYGWYNPDSGGRDKLKWGALNRTQREARDREIEAALRPMLVAQFVKHLTELSEGEIYNEWLEIEKTLRDWKSTE